MRYILHEVKNKTTQKTPKPTTTNKQTKTPKQQQQQKKTFLCFSSSYVIPRHISEHQVMDGSMRVEKFPLQRAVLQFPSSLLPSLKHLEMLWSGAGYCIKITICLIRCRSSAAPTILLQTVTSSSCLGGSFNELLCKPKPCTRGNSSLNKGSVAWKLYIKTNTEGQSMLLLMAISRRK